MKAKRGRGEEYTGVPAGPGRRTWLDWAVLSAAVLLVVPQMTLMQCQTRGCSPGTTRVTGATLDLPDRVRTVAAGQYASVWMEIGDTDVFTPTASAGGTVLTTGSGQTIPFLDDLATKGYIAIRVPHAPPAYAASSLQPGIPDAGADDPVLFNYYSPPSAASVTTSTVDIVRRADLEAIVSARYPINDGRSHWEVWWLPPGEEFPIPEQPFRLDTGSWPQPLELRFRIDFGAGASAEACAGCQVEVLAYNGYVFAGPWPFALRYGDTSTREPLVAFGPHCGYLEESLTGTIGQYISPSVPFTHVHCLENWDNVERTFSVDTASTQGWDYTYYSRQASSGAPLVPLGTPPFSITVDAQGGAFPGCLGILAVHTPAVALTDTLRETFNITATSVLSVEVRASSFSLALAPGYQLDEGGAELPFKVYLPLLMRRYP